VSNGCLIERFLSPDELAKILLIAKHRPGVYKVEGTGEEYIQVAVIDGIEYIIDGERVFSK